MKLLAIFEFSPPQGWMMSELLEALKKNEAFRSYKFISGFLGNYRHRGLSLPRLANLFYVYLRVIVEFVRYRPNSVLVRSSPPLIQVWTVCIARLSKVPVIYWLMDNHPEIEARWAEKRGLVTLARLFRAIDVWSLNRMTAIITLDEAMASVCRNLAPGVPLVVHPTWGKTVSLDGSRMTGLHRDAKSPLRLAYAGNLGASHGTEVLHRLLRALSNRHPLNLAFIGVARTSEGTVKTLADNVKADLTILPRTPFEKLGELFQSMSSDMGIVLMKDSAAGVLSPSKFSGYIAHGLPFIYIGPDGTNAALVVDRFGAGIRLSNDANEEEITSAAARILDIREREFWRQNSLIAKNYFDSKNAQSLALEILPFFESGNNH